MCRCIGVFLICRVWGITHDPDNSGGVKETFNPSTGPSCEIFLPVHPPFYLSVTPPCSMFLRPSEQYPPRYTSPCLPPCLAPVNYTLLNSPERFTFQTCICHSMTSAALFQLVFKSIQYWKTSFNLKIKTSKDHSNSIQFYLLFTVDCHKDALHSKQVNKKIAKQP